MNDVTLAVMPNLVEFATYNVDGAIIVEIIQESI